MISVIGAPYGTHSSQAGEGPGELVLEMEGPACLLHLRIPPEGIAIRGDCLETDDEDDRKAWQESLWLAWCCSLEGHPHPMLYVRCGPRWTEVGYSLSTVAADQHIMFTRDPLRGPLCGVREGGYDLFYSQDNEGRVAIVSAASQHVALDHNFWLAHTHLPAKGPAEAGYSIPPRPPIPWRPDVVSLYTEFSRHSLVVTPLPAPAPAPSPAPVVPREGPTRFGGRGFPGSHRPRGER